jgi:hypothetical protein
MYFMCISHVACHHFAEWQQCREIPFSRGVPDSLES